MIPMHGRIFTLIVFCSSIAFSQEQVIESQENNLIVKFEWEFPVMQGMVDALPNPIQNENLLKTIDALHAIEQMFLFSGFGISEDVSEGDSKVLTVHEFNLKRRGMLLSLFKKMNQFYDFKSVDLKTNKQNYLLAIPKVKNVQNWVEKFETTASDESKCNQIYEMYLWESLLLNLVKPEFARSDLGYLDENEKKDAGYIQDLERAQGLVQRSQLLGKEELSQFVPKSCLAMSKLAWVRSQFAIQAKYYCPFGVAANMCGRSYTAHFFDKINDVWRKTDNPSDTVLDITIENSTQQNIDAGWKFSKKFREKITTISQEDWESYFNFTN